MVCNFSPLTVFFKKSFQKTDIHNVSFVFQWIGTTYRAFLKILVLILKKVANDRYGRFQWSRWFVSLLHPKIVSKVSRWFYPDCNRTLFYFSLSREGPNRKKCILKCKRNIDRCLMHEFLALRMKIEYFSISLEKLENVFLWTFQLSRFSLWNFRRILK